MGEIALNEILLIGIGGAIGAILRYSISKMIPVPKSGFPIATFLVNIVGSFLIGFLIYSAFNTGKVTEEFRLFFSVGFLGGLTTMSTFAAETFRFLEQNRWGLLSLYLIGTVLLAVLCVYLGKLMADWCFPPVTGFR